MLEYDDKTSRDFNSFYSRGYAEGFMIGRLSSKFRILKSLTKKYTDNQINGIDPVEGDDATLIKFLNRSVNVNNDLLDFYHKYESLNEDQLIKRYIAESEYLPWRRL